MVASRLLEALLGGRNSLDMPVAALAGLAVAFVAFAAPADLLAGLVGATGIASIVPAAEPPLGMTARMAIGAGGGLLVFAVAFLLLRWLGRFGGRTADDRDEITELEVPRLRRRDIHPDAPARPPLLAVHELGEPELELDQLAPEPLAAALELAPAAPEMPAAAPEMPLAAEVPPPQLLARKPDRQAAPAPAFGQSFDSQAPIPKPPASLETGARPSVADVVLDEQARAYALSQRNWADFDPEPEPELEPEAQAESEPEPVPELEPEQAVEIEHPWLAEPAQGPAAPWSSASPEAWGFSQEDSPVLQIELNGHDEPPHVPRPEAAPDWDLPSAETASWNPTPADWATHSAGPVSGPVAGPEPIVETDPVAESTAVPEWTAEILPEPASDPLLESQTEWAEPAGPEPVIAAEPIAELSAEWVEPVEPQRMSGSEPVAGSEPQDLEESATEWAEVPAPTPVGSIAELMERLEKGLARHRVAVSSQKPGGAPAARPSPVRPISPDPADDRLQHAIERLQRFASRQD